VEALEWQGLRKGQPLPHHASLLEAKVHSKEVHSTSRDMLKESKQHPKVHKAAQVLVRKLNG